MIVIKKKKQEFHSKIRRLTFLKNHYDFDLIIAGTEKKSIKAFIFTIQGFIFVSFFYYLGNNVILKDNVLQLKPSCKLSTFIHFPKMYTSESGV